MKKFVLVMFVLFLAAVLPATAQRNAHKTSSAQAAYGGPPSERYVKKTQKKKRAKAKSKKTRNKISRDAISGRRTDIR